MILWHMGLTMVIIWFVMRGNVRVDYRIVALASLLPDIIDKPVGRIFFKSTFDSGRIFGHTLVFNVGMLCLLFFMRGKAKRKFVLVPTAALLHLAQDGLWSNPEVFWWPLFGAEFPKDPVPGGLLAFANPANVPGVLWQEAVGLLLIAWLFASHGMLNRAGIKSFIRTGMLTDTAATEGSR